MADALETVRRFNRFFTTFVGALDAGFLGTKMSLPEARVLFEIESGNANVASRLEATLDMDAGYVSRILHRLEKRGWITRTASADDRRSNTIHLLKAGRAAFRSVDSRQRAKVEEILDRLTPVEQNDLTEALNLSRILLAGPLDRSFRLRPFRTGDMGKIASRQSLLYQEAYSWDRKIEVHEGEVTTAFLRDFKEGREQCWVAEIEGVMAGSIFLTDEGAGLSRLRLLYVEPFARGRGIGNALVAECVAFARSVGYSAITLWTHTILESARRIYAARGFQIVSVETHSTFGKPLDGETWRLELQPSSGTGAARPETVLTPRTVGTIAEPIDL